MARAKQTDRAEARRRYRQATSVDAGAEGLEEDASVPERERPEPARPVRQPQPSGRPGFTSAFREAYHAPHVREDLAALPRLLRHWSFFVPALMIIVGAFVSFTFWNFSGGRLAFQLLVLPGSGFGLPQLVAGFFAPRASYLLGLLVSIVQGVVGAAFVVQLAAVQGPPLPSGEIPTLLFQSFVAGPITGLLFAAAAAWYRRFLALSGPRRAAASGRQPSRQQAKRR